jgi:nitrite reductase/ring-hydroxylating ferredoxin subunit
VCRADDLGPGQVKHVGVGRYGVGVFNVSGSYYALTNYCPHRGAPLCRGTVTGTTDPTTLAYGSTWSRDGEILRCPWHGWEFDIATGRTLTEPTKHVRTYPVIVNGDDLYVEVPDGQVAEAGSRS